MAQKALWFTTGGAGDGASTYTEAELIHMWRTLFLGDKATQGVCLADADYTTPLNCTAGTGKVTVAPGAAINYGYFFWSTADVDLTIDTPSAATRCDRVVSRALYAAGTRTVRLYVIKNDSEVDTAPAITQNTGTTTWDIKLWKVHVTTAGVITVEDERVTINPNILIKTRNLEDGLLTADATGRAKMADAFITLAKMGADSVDDTIVGNRVLQFYRRQGGNATDWDNNGTTTYTPTTVRAQAGSRRVTVSPAASNGTFTVTFPTAFSGTPLVLITPVGNEGNKTVYYVIDPHVATCTVGWFTTDSSTVVAVQVHWLAIGPE